MKNPTLIQRFLDICELLSLQRKPKLGTKYFVTDSGGSGDLTRPTHYFYFEEVKIPERVSCIEWRGYKEPTSNSRLLKLEEIQSRIPAKEFGKLNLILLSEQQKRDRQEIPCPKKKNNAPELLQTQAA